MTIPRFHEDGRKIGYPRSIQCANGNIVTTYDFWNEQTGSEPYITATLWKL